MRARSKSTSAAAAASTAGDAPARLALAIGGSGRCDAERLIAEDVSVSLAGSADARVHADRALRASILGRGVLFHAGAALPTLSLVGGGRVSRI